MQSEPSAAPVGDAWSARARRDQPAQDSDPVPDLARGHVAETDDQRRGNGLAGSLVVGCDPVVAQSSYVDSCGACPSNDPLLVHPGRQPEQRVVAGVEAGDGRALKSRATAETRASRRWR